MSAETDLAAADYSQWSRNCDVVMKGGITSGVVYPHAVCELAQTYRFRNVGGTSAGAIAAAATAAAEYGREREGFNKLARLPGWLGTGTNLRNLFQPQRKTGKLYAVLLAGVDGGRGAALVAAVAEHIPMAVLGALPGLALTAGALVGAASIDSTVLMVAAMFVAGLVGGALAALGAALAVALRIAWEASRRIPDNGFGLCRGESESHAGSVKPLTPWLTDLLNEFAHLPRDTPLTFGHLWAGPERPREDAPEDPDERFLQLAMMTTNLTNRRAHELPFSARDWFFRPEEMRQLFPPEVCDWLESHSLDKLPFEDTDAGRRSRMRLALAKEKGLLALPLAADLPVVVAARMSLSFPVLLSAVPLWKFDMTRKANKALGEWRQWAADQEGFDALSQSWRTEGRPKGKPIAECCWFSDGGISSNFPVHFFDRLVPRWPTFALNLRPFPFDEKLDPDDERNNTWMVKSNKDGWKEWWYRFPPRPSSPLDGRLPAFFESIVRTMQNRVDEAQMRVPGYRDRVAHVSMEPDEGGMNLTMPKPMIDSLTARGRAAATRLAEAYGPLDDPERVITWDNHRWVRLRSSLSVFEEMHGHFADGYDGDPLNGDRTYLELIERRPNEPPGSYKWRGNERDVAQAAIRGIAAAVKKDGLTGSVRGTTPGPIPVGKIVPRD